MFFNDHSPQNSSWLLAIKTSEERYDLIRVNKHNEMKMIITNYIKTYLVKIIVDKLQYIENHRSVLS